MNPARRPPARNVHFYTIPYIYYCNRSKETESLSLWRLLIDSTHPGWPLPLASSMAREHIAWSNTTLCSLAASHRNLIISPWPCSAAPSRGQRPFTVDGGGLSSLAPWHSSSQDTDTSPLIAAIWIAVPPLGRAGASLTSAIFSRSSCIIARLGASVDFCSGVRLYPLIIATILWFAPFLTKNFTSS